VHHLLHDGFDPALLGRMPHGGELSHRSELTDTAQDVVGKTSKGENQAVGGELRELAIINLPLMVEW
jgi:hypothetical protein